MEFDVICSKRNTMAAEIKGNKLIIRAPLFATNEDINRFMLQHKKWLDTHLEKAQERAKTLDAVHKLTQEEIVVHELCHRKEMNHSDKFYVEVLRVFPTYWEQDKWLKENGDILMAMFLYRTHSNLMS